MADKRVAYAAVIRDASLPRLADYPYGIGQATENEAGYRPVTNIALATYEEAQIKAHELNQALGLSGLDAIKIVASSMGTQNREREQQRAESRRLRRERRGR